MPHPRHLLVGVLVILALACVFVQGALDDDATTTITIATIPPVDRSLLTHPDVITFPLGRSMSNQKTMRRAASGDVNAQRLARIMAHGYRLNAEEESQRLHTESVDTMSTTPTPAPFSGCPFVDFTIPVVIGGQTFQLIADTGSATLAVVGSSCTNCVTSAGATVNPRWSSSAASSQYTTGCGGQCPSDSTYGDGSGWMGGVWTDNVTLSSSFTSTSNLITPQVIQRIVVITAQSTQGYSASGAADSSATYFFNNDACNDANATQKAQAWTQGIIGIGSQAITATNTDSFMAKLFEQNPSLPKLFTLQTCEYSGQMWIGGSDTSSYRGNVGWVPMMGSPSIYFYSLQPSQVYIDAVPMAGVSTSDWPSQTGQVVDSGTTYWSLPTNVYQAVTNAITASAGWKKHFRTDFFSNPPTGSCEQSIDSATYAQLQQDLPTISIQFTNNVTLTMDGVASYLMPCSKKYQSWVPGIADAGIPSQGVAIGGWSMMNQFVIQHDLSNYAIGFAVQASCATSPAPLKASVTTGPPLPSSASGGSSSSSSGGSSAGGNGASSSSAGGGSTDGSSSSGGSNGGSSSGGGATSSTGGGGGGGGTPSSARSTGMSHVEVGVACLLALLVALVCERI